MAATAPNIQTYCSILISTLFQLLFGMLHLGMSGTFCQELHHAGHVQNSPAWTRVAECLCGLGKCPAGQGSAMRCEGFGMASEPRGEQHRDHRIPGTAAETSLLLPHTPEGRQRLKTRLSQSTHKKFKTCLA